MRRLLSAACLVLASTSYAGPRQLAIRAAAEAHPSFAQLTSDLGALGGRFDWTQSSGLSEAGNKLTIVGVRPAVVTTPLPRVVLAALLVDTKAGTSGTFVLSRDQQHRSLDLDVAVPQHPGKALRLSVGFTLRRVVAASVVDYAAATSQSIGKFLERSSGGVVSERFELKRRKRKLDAGCASNCISVLCGIFGNFFIIACLIGAGIAVVAGPGGVVPLLVFCGGGAFFFAASCVLSVAACMLLCLR